MAVLVMFSTRISNNTVNNTHNSIFQETIIWPNENKAYTLLLHTVSFEGDSFSAYSKKMNTFMTFPALPSDSTFINNKLGSFSYTPQKCINCHQPSEIN